MIVDKSILCLLAIIQSAVELFLWSCSRMRNVQSFTTSIINGESGMVHGNLDLIFFL